MNEPKKRGPKPKCKSCGRKEGEGHYDDCEVGMGVLPCDPPCDPAAQAYALRVWNGQSDTVPRAERIARVKRALDGQGLSMEGVELP